MDERKEFIISTAGRYFCISPDELALESYSNDEILEGFLDSPKMKSMYVLLKDNRMIFKEFQALNKENNSPGLVGRLLIFFKTKPDPLSSENYLDTILVLSVNDSFLQSLYYAIQDIFTPAILLGNVPEVRPSLAGLFEKLEEEMRSTLFSSPRATDEIKSVDDELMYWKTVDNSVHKKLNADVRKYLLDSMQPLCTLVKSFVSVTKSDVDDTLENIMNILDDVWKHDFKYPLNKMIKLLTIIGNELVRSLQINLSGTEDWHDPLTNIENKLLDSITLCEKWSQITKKLTFLYWPNYANNPWTEKEFIPVYPEGFMGRLKEVLKLRMIFTQLQIALVDYDRDMDYSRLLKPFEEVNYLLYNYYTEPRWRSAVNTFYEFLSVIEPDIIDVFRLKFQAYGSNLTALIMELSRFDLLLQLPSVLNSLSSERQNFLEQIQYNVSSIYPAAFNDVNETVLINLEVSQLVYPIAEARINLNKLGIYSKFAEDTLHDIRGYDELLADITELRSKLKELEERQFKSWNEKVLIALKANEFRFATSDPVVYFQSEKLLQVNFSDKLFDLINDTRKLTAYGFTIDQRIVDAASKAKRFMEQAKLLFQVASFHNTMSERIVTSQSPMILNSARELARLVQTEHSVTWENSREVDEYIKRMQTAVGNLANENNRLVNYHSIVMRKVETLALAPVSEFIRQNDFWLRTLGEIRSVVEEVEEKFTDTMAWRRHIDLQICKVLDVKYRWYLDTIEENLPEMQIMLVYKNQKVEYSPSLCVVKREYFRKIKDSIDRLLETKGIGDEKLYSTIKDKNCHKFSNVTSRIEVLFSQLQEYSTTWRSWLSISRVDIESFFKSYKSIKSEDWNRNFRASKFFGQQIAQIPSSQMVGPFYVSLVPLKMSIEWLNRSSWNTLREMLKLSILEDVDVLNLFVSQVYAITDNQAQRAEEFINFRVEHKNLEKELDVVMTTAANLESKNSLLRSWAREVVPSVTDATAALAQAKSKLKNYDALLQQQIDIFRVKVQAQANQLITSIQLFFLKWNEEKPSDNLLQNTFTFQELKTIMVPIRERRAQWEELKKEIEKTKSDFGALDIEPPDFGEYSESTVSLEDVLQQMSVLEEFHDGLDKLGQEEWILISSRAYQMTVTYLEDWKFKLKPLQPSRLAHRIIEDIDKIEEFLPHLEFLRGEVLTDKHWADILEMLNIQKSKDKVVYADLLARMESIKSHSDALKAINAQAASEIGIIQALSELDAWEVEAKFSTYEHINFKGETVLLIKDVKGISNKIGDYQCLLQSIKASSSLTTFADRVTIWESRLNNLDQCIQDVIHVQRKWAYLEPIFGNWNLEGIKFERINKEWNNILVQLSDSSFRVAALSRMPNIFNVLQSLLQSLSQCQRALQNFLEGKRLHFPRFYFLNDDDLLEILGQSDKAHVIQSHLKKIFVGIHSVGIENRGGVDVITAVYSAQGESVVLNKAIMITSKAEEWLTELSEEVKSTLKTLVVSCMTKPDPDRFPSQVLCLSERINFTTFCEEAITTNGLSQYRLALETQHAAYSKQLLELNGNKMEKHGVLHLKLKDLLFDTIYHLGIVKTLIKTDVKHTDDWNWQKILRFYSDSDGSVLVKMVDAQFDYTYEYQGNIPKLVHTSLTDKCYLTLTQAASLGFGGNPYGPAGTGKTESVKALGALLGRQVLVFNCDEGLDADSLMRIMIGIIKSGAWGCFDEFNRLDETTLSLISLQISIIQHALRNKSQLVTLGGREVSLDNNSGIFITLNPAGKGYGGRQKLPENLKQLFRPVLMSKPDDREITQVILHCEGFTKAEEIGKKIVTLFGQARSLLSHQQHYDFGLRAIKTVVGSCGSSLRKFLSANQNASSNDEYRLAVNAVRLNTRCKLTHSDAIRFDELIKDIFPNVEFIPSGRDDILTALHDAYNKLNLVYDEKQSSKCIELLEQMEQRMGVVVVGPQSSGKTTLILLLKCALETTGVKVRHDWFNPKSMPRNQLLGQIDVDTRQWTDGLLTNIAQSVYNEFSDVQCWVHSDGDIDPEWVESLNSVLDDNHLLTLPSGWRIQFGDNVHFIFETHSLQFASPATISRMGIILMSDEDLDYKTCIQQHVGSLDSQDPHSSAQLFQLIFQVVLNDHGMYSNYNLLRYNESDDSITYYSDQYVQTTDCLTLTPSMIPLTDLLRDYVMKDHPFILIAPAGSGKSIITNHIFGEIPSIQVVSIDCSAYLQPHHIIQRLSQECITVTRNSRRTIIPKHAERVVIHFSDLDGVHEDRYGTRVLVEFLKQAIERKGFYDDLFEWIGLENVTFIFSVRYIDGLPARFIDLLNIVYMKPITIPEQKEVIAMWGKMKFNDVDCSLIHEALSKLIDNVHKKSNNEKGNHFGKYMFTLREYDKLIDNLARHNMSDKTSMVEAYICEARRVLKDQIDDFELRISFETHLDDSIRSAFGLDYAGLLYEDSYYVLDKQKPQSLAGHGQQSNYIQAFMKLNLEDWKAEIRLACVQLGNFFMENLLLVPDFLELVAKIEFILCQPGGSILFPSKPGSGKKTALQIVSQRLNASIYMLKLNSGYGISNFQNDLKMIIQMAGIAGESVILILEDFQIIDPEFLNMISCLISHGEVFGLYSAEEYEALSSQLKSSMENDRYDDTTISYLRKRVHSNVHLVLIYEYDNVSFLELFRSNPSLPKLCYTIYSNEFSSDTMFTIPEEILKKDKAHADMLSILDKIAGFLATMHGETIRLIPKTTPLSFFYAIRTYMKFFSEKRTELLDRQQRLQLGVTKISEAQSLVDKLKFEANEQKLLLDERQANGRLVLDQISDTMTKANFRKNEMEKLKVDAVTKNTTLVARKAEIDKELESITPLVEAAQSAVGNIKPEALTEIRSLRVPPKIIRDILEAVLCLMGILDTSWSSMKSFLAGRGIRDEIRFFDARQITDDNRSSVLKLLQANKESFDIKNARRASVAAAPLAAWVQANVKYSIVLEKIRPLNEELADLERNLNEAGEQIVELETALSNVDDTVAQLKDQLSSSTREAAEIEVRLAGAQKTISAAEGLVSKLNDEYLVWNKQLTELSKSMGTLHMNCAISAGFVTYLAGADINTRATVVESWEASLDSKGLVSVNEFLMTERDVLHWQSEGLPGDEYSLQNTAILLNTMMPLLLLDPASTATKFLTNHFQDAKVESISIKSTKFVNSLELAVKFGKVLVVLDVDDIHPMLIPILRQEFVYQGPRRMVYVGNKIIDYDVNFRIFLTTRSLNMKQRASIPGFISIVNYSPTIEGLTQQLLSSTLRLEKPDLEKRRLELLQEEEQLKNKLFFLQEKVLKELADSQGDILQNQELLESLKNTKESSDAIKKSLEEAVQIKDAMAKECMVYESFALLGTRIFFACASLSNINNMYHLSVEKYISLFEKSLTYQKQEIPMTEKSQNLIIFIYHYICRSLFKDDRLTFALQLIHAVYAETFNPGEWEFFIGKTPISDSFDSAQLEELPSWVTKELQTADEILRLKVHCPNLYNSIKLEDASEWMRFVKQANPRLPEHCALTPFQYILVLKALRPDMLHNELTNYSLQKLGLTSLSPSVLKLNTLLDESGASVPILIITSPGTDPSEELRSLALVKNISNMKEMVLGPGLESTTITTLREANKQGTWVLLKNLHLVIHWLPVLENEIRQLSPHSHESFRLWMTTESHHNFPEVLLSASLKISYEAPPGMKNNLLRTYHEWETQRALETSDEGGRAMFILSWFHALIQERRSYIPQGWTSFYEFNDVDLSVATSILKKIISKGKNSKIQWQFVRGLYEFAVYGGRVNNVFDLRVLSSYLKFFFNQEIFKKNGRPLVANVYLPESGSIDEHFKVINLLPNENDPEYFGLPPNVEVIRHRVVIRKLYEQFKELDKSNVLQDVAVEHMSKSVDDLLSLWTLIKERLNMKKFKTLDCQGINSILTFLGLENEFSSKLVEDVDASFSTVHQTLNEGAFPKKGILNFALAIYHQQVPEEWSNVWLGPTNPAAWLESVVTKAVALQSLHDSMKEENLSVIEMSNIFHGTDFFMALKQDAARARRLELDRLTLKCSLEASPSVSQGSMLITGLLLQGALIVGGALEMTLTDSLSVSEAPTLTVSWELQEESLDDFVPIPLYSNESRDEVIAELLVPCKRGEKTKWIKAGTAFYVRA